MIGSNIAVTLFMLLLVCAFVWAAYASYNPQNSASGFGIVIFTVADLIIDGIILHNAEKEISKVSEEIS